tara:strand:+ start:2900 stop:3439 length:540 start_codon:yes stop_codon:yes gene_type:complete
MNYFLKYFKNLNKSFADVDIKHLQKLGKKILDIKKKNKKILIFGNGGSIAIASHVAVDFAKNLNISISSFTDPSLVTCFSNDYKFENYIKEIIKLHANQGDMIILISSSGKSKNMINAIKYAKFSKIFIATFTGFNKNNYLNKHGDISFWINSQNYNVIENTHQIWLLTLCDYLAKKRI